MSAHARLLTQITDAIASGDMAVAVRLCRKQLRKRPSDTATLKLLVHALLRSGEVLEARNTAERLLQLAPNDYEALLLLGHVLRLGERPHDARLKLEQAVSIHPNDARAHHELALTLRIAGTLSEALEAFEQAAALDPANSIYQDNLYLALIEAGRPHDAVARCREALARGEALGDLHAILGRALAVVGDYAGARPELERALASAPNDLGVASSLGSCLVQLGEFEPGIRLLRRCTAAHPGSPVARNNLVRALAQAGRATEVVQEYRNHGSGLALPALVGQLVVDNRLPQAERLLAAALGAWPDDRELQIEQARLLVRQGQNGAAATIVSRLATDAPDDEAVQAVQVLLDCANGRHTEALATVEQKLTDTQSKRRLLESLLYRLNFADDCPPEVFYRLHLAWATTIEPIVSTSVLPHFDHDQDPERRLRVGYVSPDFRDHSVAFFFESLLDGHDPNQVEVYCYANHVREDAVTRRLRAKAGHWRQIEKLDDDHAADLIRADGIDLLVDLAGHTRGHRLSLFALHPAPVQVSCIGYPNTTGLRSIDYRLTDPIADPDDSSERFYTERLFRLPKGHLCYRGDAALSPTASREIGDAPTFGSFNNLEKLSDTTLRLWSRILRELPRARLLLKAKQLAHARERERLLGRFAALGVIADRLELIERIEGKQAHMRLYDRIDIALDTTPYNGVTTTCEALWMGVPVIALRGDRHVARVAASLLHFAGLPELIAETSDEFVDKAVALAGDRERLTRYHAGLREQLSQSSLCDQDGYARQVEAAYRTMWRRYLEQAAGG